jgi:CHAT domain-containing protein
LATQPVPWPESVAWMRVSGILAPLFLCLAACGLACGQLPLPRSRPPDTLQAPPTPRTLPSAAKPADQRELRLTLPAGTYVRLAIVSTPMDLAVRQLGPEGKPAEQVQLAGGAAEPTRLSWVATAAGEYLWAVEPRGPQGLAGSVAIALEEERPAGSCDETRVRVERAVIDAQWEMSRPGDQAPQGTRARALLEPALPGTVEVGEQQGLLATLLARARAARREGTPDAADRLQGAMGLARAIGDRQAEADAMEELAQLLQPAPALGSLQTVVELRQQLGDERGQAAALYLSGYYYSIRDVPSQALQCYRAALALQWRNDDLDGQPWSLCELGALYGKTGDVRLARDYLDLCLDRARAAGNLKAQALALEESARLDIELGQLQVAHDEYLEAHKLLAAVAHGTFPARALDGLATVLLYLGEPEKARQRFEEALAALGTREEPMDRAHALLGIGSALEAEGHPPRALEYLQKALEIIRAHGIRSMESLALYDLGSLHRKLRWSMQAIPELETAVALEVRNSPSRQAQTQVELAKAYSDAGRTSAATAAFVRAIQLGSGTPVVEAAAQAGLARIQRDSGDLGPARSAIVRAIEITEQIRSGVIRPDQRVSFLASRRAYFEFYVDLLMRLDRLQPGHGHDVEALAVSEKARARELLDLLAKEHVEVRRGIPPELRQQEKELGERIARLQTRLLSSADLMLPRAEVQRIEHDLSQAEEAEKDLDADVRRRQPAYASVRAPRPLSLQEIQDLLDERTALLEFFVGDDSSYLFVVTHRKLAVHALPARHRLADLVDRITSAVHRENQLGARRFVADSHELYRLLLQAAAMELRGKPRLIVAPDGVLYAVNFELLLTSPVPNAGRFRADLPYLIRERSVSYVPSASVLAQLLAARHVRGEAVRSGEKVFVGFGDPELGGEAARTPRSRADCGQVSASGGRRGAEVAPTVLDRTQPLPAARDEVCRIAGLYGREQAVVYIGSDATEENVKTNTLVRSAWNLHFATHGLLDENHPELSGLKLAHDAGSTEDGLLQVREIFNLELHADLVVLSACQSGLGKEVSGEGLIGMTRAFLYAGAGSMVVSLWRVDDESTSDLMVSFYRSLQELGNKSEALRRAKLELIDRSPYSHPYFWAPFILIGRPE